MGGKGGIRGGGSGGKGGIREGGRGNKGRGEKYLFRRGAW